MKMRWFRMIFWLGLAFVNFAICAKLAEAGRITVSILFIFVAIGWVFICLGVLGKRGLAETVWIVAFLAGIFFFWLGFSALLKPHPTTVWENLVFLALVPISIFVLVSPMIIGTKLWKIVAKLR